MRWSRDAGLGLGGRSKLPVIVSTEVAECGLACLAMLANFHGHDVDLNALRQRFAFSLAGATLRSLMAVANELELTSRPLKVELDGLRHIAVPAILHWNLNHFVVLKKATDSGLVIHDPSVGARAISWAEASNRFSGIALELAPASTFRKIEAKSPVRLSSLWSRMTGAHLSMAQLIGLSAALQLLAFAAPFQLQLVVDRAILQADKDFLLVLAIAFGGLTVLHATIELLRGWTLQLVTQTVAFQVAGNIVRHLLRLPSDFFEKRHVGDILSRLGSARAIQDILTQGLVAAILDGAMAVAACAIMYVYSPGLASIVVAAVVINLAVSLAAFPGIRSRSESEITEGAREQTHLMETVRAATIIKLSGREIERESTWRNLRARVVQATLGVGKWKLTVQWFHTTVAGLQTVLVIYFGAAAIISAEGFSVGMLVAFLAFRQMFTDRTLNLINQSSQFRLIALHLERLADIVGTEADTEGFANVEGVKPAGRIALEGVSFRYGVTDRLVLNDIRLSVEPGEFLAITGRSGGGKTTLLKLMLGLHKPTSGSIQLDDREAAPALWRSWREHVGVVSQDDRLLSGTLAENISFFDPDLDMVRVVDAAKRARIHDEIECMPMQYRSLVGDMGSALSGGQKQRVLLARALYREPSVLFLDEGTANLDVGTEGLIADLICAMPITRVVVAHRPALLERADRVIAVEDGAVEVRQIFRPAIAAAT